MSFAVFGKCLRLDSLSEAPESSASPRGEAKQFEHVFACRPELMILKARSMSDPQTLIFKLARLAHETWCERMLEDGWRPGATFDPGVRIHDALVPFEQLGPIDRRSAYLRIVVAEIAGEVENACQYSRGPTRELSVADMRIGLRVRLYDSPSEIDTVVSWEEDHRFRGALNTIRVCWDSGELVDHAAPERELLPQNAI